MSRAVKVRTPRRVRHRATGELAKVVRLLGSDRYALIRWEIAGFEQVVDLKSFDIVSPQVDTKHNRS